jgi:hypothetical protein
MPTRAAWIALLAALLGLTALAADPAPEKPAAGDKKSENLIPNGDFEAGDGTPSGWQTVDGLSSSWVKDDDPAHGKVLKFDTDVLQSQAYDWWVKVARGASANDAPKKEPSKDPNKYDTLAGNDGVWFWSDFIPVEKGKAYWLTLDAKGPGPVMVWLVGYPEKASTALGADEGAFQEYLQGKVGTPQPNKRGRDPFIHKYVWKGQLAANANEKWQTFSRRKQPFRPTSVTPNVRYLRVLILPTWPPGVYYVDNVKLTEVEDN